MGPVTDSDAADARVELSDELISTLDRRFGADEENLRQLRRSARRIERVVDELGKRDLGPARRIVRKLTGLRGPIKHELRELKQGPGRRTLLNALRFERDLLIQRTVKTRALKWQEALNPDEGFGMGFDERVVEIPLAIECIDPAKPGIILDAGAALNLPQLRNRLRGAARVMHYTQSADAEPIDVDANHFSYLFGDLRQLPFKDGVFDRIVCISTLEHIGMDNQRYGGPVEDDPGSWLRAVSELARVLSPTGQMLLTAPFGRVRNLGWYRVLGDEDVAALREVTAKLAMSVRYFACDGGWFDAEPEKIFELDSDPAIIRGLVIARLDGAGGR